MDEIKTDLSNSTIDACIQHASDVLAIQLGLVEDKGYDFAPEFKDMTTQLYLFGVVWRFAESLKVGGNARDTAFSALEEMLIRDGMRRNSARKRVTFLKQMSQVADGRNALAVAIGYQSQSGDNSLVEVFDHYVDDFQVSGDFWRLYDRTKKTMLYGGLIVAFVVIWIITLYLPGNSTIAIFAASLMAAALFVVPVFLIGLLVYKVKIKNAKNSTSSTT
tara:strand:- start:782 stop:1438 length:657 start_codon:yes stop_codon:yes gene_type:complete